MTQHADFPDLRQGLSWPDTSAHQWRNLIDAVRAMNSLEVGHGLRLVKTADSWQLNLDVGKQVIPQTFRKAVVLVEVPPEGSARDRPWLLVQEVEYATAARTVEPPDDRDHPYRWRGVPFQAYPQIGRGPDEYFDALWDEPGPPTLGATFLTATFDGAAWILDTAGAGATITVALRAIQHPILRIRRVKYAAAPPALPLYDWDGEAFDAYPAFGLTAADFVGFEWFGPLPVIDGTAFLKARLVDGFWLVDLGAVPPVEQFRFKRHLGDYLVAAPWQGGQESAEVNIAKPYILRREPFDGRTRGDWSYEYESHTRRTATLEPDQDFTETQIYIPRYQPDDIIYASRIRPGVLGELMGNVGEFRDDITWLEDNRDGRTWAAEFEEEAP